jgi:hypothetical protein
MLEKTYIIKLEINNLNDLIAVYSRRYAEDKTIRDFISKMSVEDTHKFYSWYYKYEPNEELCEFNKIILKKLASSY